MVKQEVADKGRVFINDKVAKSSTDVKVEINRDSLRGTKHTLVQVEALLNQREKEDASEMFYDLKRS